MPEALKIIGLKRVLLLLLLACSLQCGYGQVRLLNPSFEDEPKEATMPSDWLPCEKGTTPDILPGPWDVTLAPSHGKTYMGIITREDGTKESISQEFSSKLEVGVCHVFELDLARSDSYANYNLPIQLRIWIGHDECHKAQLIQAFDHIEHATWETYTFRFTPTSDYSFLTLEARNAKGVYLDYRGNVLIDNIRPIKKCIRASL